MKLFEKPKFNKKDAHKWSKLYMRLKRKEQSELDVLSKRLLKWHEAYVKLLYEKRKILDESC